MSLKTISLFIPNLVGGGAERVTTHLANGLANRGYRVDMVLIEKIGPYLADLDPAVQVVDLHSRTVRNGILPLARYLREKRPDVLLSALDYANVGALLARRASLVNTRVIVTVHITHSQAAVHDRGIHYAIIRKAISWTYPWADAIVAVSRGAAEDMIHSSYVPRHLVRVIYNPVITSQLRSLAREPMNHPWFAVGQPPVVLAIGRLTAQKDYPTLLRATGRLRQNLNFRLVILGEGEDRSHLEHMVEELALTRDVALPGFVNNPFAYLAHASLFVLSSAWEALPTVLIEALALGVPIVSTDCASGPTEILRCGQYGRLVPVGNVEALATAMRETLSEPHRSIPDDALRPFFLDSAVDRYVELIEELTGP
jgi:glycosyltransferase involved in cell wall biosynthesis